MYVAGGLVALATAMPMTHKPPKAEAIEALLEQQAQWQLPFTIRSRDVVGSLGGLTNRGIIFEHHGLKVLRLNAPASQRLGIDRHREWQILHQLAPLQIAPQPVYKDANNQILVYEYIDGECLGSPLNHQQQQQVQELIQRYQKVPLKQARFNYLAHLQHYWQHIERLGLANSKLRNEWRAALPKLEQFQQGQWQGVLTHHDLQANNIVHTRSGLKILDWEYAALGHPGFDYACINQEYQDHSDALYRLRYWLEELWQLVQNA